MGGEGGKSRRGVGAAGGGQGQGDACFSKTHIYIHVWDIAVSISTYAFVNAKSLQSCPTLCDPMDHRPPGSSVHGILQARILEGAAMPSSRDLPNPEIELASLKSPAWAGGFLTTSTTWEVTY